MKKLLFSLAFGLFAFMGAPEATQASTITEKISQYEASAEASLMVEPDDMFYWDSGIPDGGGGNIMFVYAKYGNEWVLICVC